MPAIKQKTPAKMTFDEFMAWYEHQEGRWELHDGVPVRLHDPVTGQSERMAHLRLKHRIMRRLEDALDKGKSDCEAVADGATVEINHEISYQPDALVYCGDRLGDDELVVSNPVIIVEVLSPSTAYKDVGDKLVDYFKLSSVAHYLIIDPKSKRITHHYRDGDEIAQKAIYGQELPLDPPSIKLGLKDLFA